MISWLNDNIWLQTSIFLIFFLIALWFVNHVFTSKSQHIENFQTQPFKLERDNYCYDSFYIEHYDTLFETEKYSTEDYDNIVAECSLSKNSSILDIGCGTGILLKKLVASGYLTFGVDASKDMVEHAQENLLHGEVDCNDVMLTPLLYEKNSFSHILCTHFTIYEIEDKRKLFQYCYSWLRLNGFLVIHMVDIESYNLIVPQSEWFAFTSDNKNSTTKERIINTKIQKNDMCYTNKYIMNGSIPIKQLETFEVGLKTRKNEKNLYMVDKARMIQMALANGFRLYKEIPYSKQIPDSHQYLVIFQKEYKHEI